MTRCDCSSVESTTVSSETAVAAVSSLAEQCALNRQQVETLARQLEEVNYIKILAQFYMVSILQKQAQHSAVTSTLSGLTQYLEEFKVRNYNYMYCRASAIAVTVFYIYLPLYRSHVMVKIVKECVPVFSPSLADFRLYTATYHPQPTSRCVYMNLLCKPQL